MILPSTFKFLQDVAENNDRDWFKLNKTQYDAAQKNVLDFTSSLIKLLSKIDPVIPSDLKASNCVMRIYRDVRFSKDKSPYKTNFGVAISSNGKNFNGPGYYVHIQPGKSFIGGGSWFPETEYLKAIRQEIDYNSSYWHEIVDNPDFKSVFGTLETEGKLKTVPKDYSSDHPDIEYLKLKSFTAGRKLSDMELTSASSPEQIAAFFEKLYPFMVFLRNAYS